MSGVRIVHEFKDKAIHELLSRLDKADTFSMFDDIGAYLDSEVNRRFIEGVDFEGNALIPSQRALNEGGTTLVDSRVLMGSYTHNVFPSGDGVEHGSNMDYAAIHHFGGETGHPNGRFEMDARPVMGINDDDESEINGIVHDFYQSVINA